MQQIHQNHSHINNFFSSFAFAKDILGNPNRGGKKSKSLASITKKRVAHFGTGSQSDNPKPTKNKKPPDLKKTSFRKNQPI